MEYKNFLEKIEKTIVSYLPQEYQDAVAEVIKVTKVNEESDGLVIRREGETAVPVLYLKQYYEERMRGTFSQQSFEETCLEIVQDYLRACRCRDEISIDKKFIIEHLFLKAVNSNRNMKLVNSAPHLKIHDLAMLPYSEVGDIGTVLITHDMAAYLGISGEQLLAEAIRKNSRNMPVCLKSMTEILAGFADMGIGVPEEEPMPFEIYVLSNENYKYGASLLANKEVLDYAAEKVGGNFYILPSSIHEVILVREEWGQPEELKAMVMEVNHGGIIEGGEVLSDNVYHYDARKRTLDICLSDVREKSREGAGRAK